MSVVFEICREGLCKLVGARGILESATDAGKTLNGFADSHSLYKSGNALCVAGTTAQKADLCNDAILNGNVDCTGANAVCLVGKTVHGL